eukprot:NODE_580_length_5759_cov_0.735512.p1 type:complete len:775 gc:universal NODE_580_length_5759_cov_0.735512:5758-3434(-)
MAGLLCSNQRLLLVVWDSSVLYYTTDCKEFGFMRSNMHLKEVALLQLYEKTFFVLVGVRDDQLCLQYFKFKSANTELSPVSLPNGDKLLKRQPKTIDDVLEYNSPRFILNRILNTNLMGNDLNAQILELTKEEQQVILNQFKLKTAAFRLPVAVAVHNSEVFVYCQQDVLVVRSPHLIETMLRKSHEADLYLQSMNLSVDESILTKFLNLYNFTNINWQLDTISNSLLFSNPTHIKQCLIPSPHLLIADHDCLECLPLIRALIKVLIELYSEKTRKENCPLLARYNIHRLHEINFSAFIVLGVCCKTLLVLHNYNDILLTEELNQVLNLSFVSVIIEWLLRHNAIKDAELINQIDLENLHLSVSTLLYEMFKTSQNPKDFEILIALPNLPCYQFLNGIFNVNPAHLVNCASYLQPDSSMSQNTPMRGGFSDTKVLQLLSQTPINKTHQEHGTLFVTCSSVVLLNYIKCVMKYEKEYVLHALVPVYIRLVQSEQNCKLIPDNPILLEYFELGKQTDFNYCEKILNNVDEDYYYKNILTTMIETNNLDMIHEFSVNERMLKVCLSLYHANPEWTVLNVLLRCLLTNLEYSKCIEVLKGFLRKPCKDTVQAHTGRSQALLIYKSILIVTGEKHDTNALKKLEHDIFVELLSIQFLLENNGPITTKKLVEFCISKQDIKSAFKLDKLAVLHSSQPGALIEFDGCLRKYTDVVRLLVVSDVKSFVSACINVQQPIPLYILKILMSHGKNCAEDVVLILLQQGYKDLGVEMLEHCKVILI